MLIYKIYIRQAQLIKHENIDSFEAKTKLDSIMRDNKKKRLTFTSYSCVLVLTLVYNDWKFLKITILHDV